MQLVCIAGIVRTYYPDSVDVPSGEITAGVRIIPWLAPKKLAELGLYGAAPPLGTDDTRPYIAPVLTAKADLVAYAATARYYKQVGGITFSGSQIDTHPSEISNITSIQQGIAAAGSASVNYKAASGFVTLTSTQFSALVVASNAHVQACFTAE